VKILDLIRRAATRPLAITGALWPLVMLAPYVPGLPRPTPSGLTWRQEILVALLFCISLGLSFARTSQAPAVSSSAQRSRIFLTFSLLSFVLWSGASALWAANPYPSLHHTFVWGAYLIFMLLAEQVAHRARLLRVSITVLGVVILVIAVSCSIGFFATPLSLFRNNGLGEPLAIAVPLFTALALGLRQKRAAFLCGLTAATAWLAMMQMSERALFIAATSGLVLLALISLALPRFRPRSIMRAVVLLMAFATAVVLQSVPSPFASEDSFKAAPPIFSRLQETHGGDVNTRARLLFWGVAIEMVRERSLTGVGADNYDVAFADARARVSSRNPDSPLVGINEGFLAVRAHNEYLQILAELGVVGFALFLSFIAALLFAAYRALRHARSPLVPGAIASLAVFSISSGASSVSFRWMGSGLVFFFAAAIVMRFARAEAPDEKPRAIKFALPFTRRTAIPAFAFSLVMLLAMGAQSLNVLMNGAAQESSNPARAESRYQSAIFWNPLDAAAHFNYGMWLYYQGRAGEAVPHTRYGVENGINTSTCYLYLASAEAEAGDLQASEATLARAIEVYPRSVFLRVRHASALAALGRDADAQAEYAEALSFDGSVARGWWQLICYGKEAAGQAARREPQNVKMPGELLPTEAAQFVVDENKRRPPDGCQSGAQALVPAALLPR
jgi:O-antigen ligase